MKQSDAAYVSPWEYRHHTCNWARIGRPLDGLRLPGCLLMTAIPGASSACLASRLNQNVPTAVLRRRSSFPPFVDRNTPPIRGTAAAAAAAADSGVSSSAMKSADGWTSDANLHDEITTLACRVVRARNRV